MLCIEYVSALIAVIIAIFSDSAVSIIPGPCVSGSSINAVCCPVPNISGAGRCGSNLSSPRGQCVEVSVINPRCVQNTSEIDPRKNWPHFFTKLCKCEGNYAGYDCGECKFGYRGDDCSERITTRRRSISTFSEPERKKYLDVIKMAKDAPYSRYKAIRWDKTDPRYREVQVQVVNVTLYDLFVWLHYYTGRENDDVGRDIQTARDFAHESGGFLTWHRLYLLWFERELKAMIDNEDFALPYWDWTKENDREIALTDKWFGGIGPYGAVISDVFGNSATWPLVCLNANSTHLCDPEIREGSLSRCPSPNECEKTDPRWPSQEDIDRALAMTDYDKEPYSRYSTSGFRNFVEGFENDDCSGGDILCAKGIRRKLHNSVHIILGIGDFNASNNNITGTMGNVPIASNDPIFPSHHAMVDYIFEQWLSQNLERQSPYKPSNDDGAAGSDSKYQGHRKDDCLVPFFPLYTNADMYKPASEFGYEYVPDSGDEPSTNPPVATTDAAVSTGPTGILVLSHVVVTLGTYMVAV